jgi:hypothetical protein
MNYPGENLLWYTNTGERIKIKDMEDTHLFYTLMKIKREGWRIEYRRIIELEIEKRDLIDIFDKFQKLSNIK